MSCRCHVSVSPSFCVLVTAVLHDNSDLMPYLVLSSTVSYYQSLARCRRDLIRYLGSISIKWVGFLNNLALTSVLSESRSRWSFFMLKSRSTFEEIVALSFTILLNFLIEIKIQNWSKSYFLKFWQIENSLTKKTAGKWFKHDCFFVELLCFTSFLYSLSLQQL